MEPHTDTSNTQAVQLASGLHSASEDLRDLLRSDPPADAIAAASAEESESNGPFVAAVLLAVVSFASLFAPAMHFRAEDTAVPTVQAADAVAPSTLATLE